MENNTNAIKPPKPVCQKTVSISKKKTKIFWIQAGNNGKNDTHDC